MINKTIKSIDNFWLNLDGNTNLMIITAVLEFDHPLNFDKLTETIEKRWLVFDRFKQRVTEPVLGLPGWEIDPDFDIRSHLHRVALPGDGGRLELQNMISDLTAMPLDRKKPLWQIHLIENYNGGCVLFWRIHHCIADGISLTHVLLSTADKAKEATLSKTKIFKDRAPKIKNIKKTTFRKIVEIPRKMDFSKWKQTATHAFHAANILKKQFFSDSPTLFKGKIGVRKCIAWSDPLSLSDAKSTGKFLGGTINDVVVTAVSGALRRYLSEKNTPMDAVNIRISMPVNIRKKGEELNLGNQFGLVNLDLPVNVGDPVQRFHEVKKRNDFIKNSPEAAMSFQTLNTMGKIPKKMSKRTADFFADKATAVYSNVPGPQKTLYFAGQPIKNMMFWVPRTGHTGMGISIISYNGKITMGLVTDEKIVDDPQILLKYFQEEMRDLNQLVAFEKVLKKNVNISQSEDMNVLLPKIPNHSTSAVKSIDFRNRLKQISRLGLKSKSFEELAQKYNKKDSQFIDINGLRVHYCDQGNGPPTIILLHGMLATLQTWNEWVNSLSDYYRIIRLDIPGFGLTDRFETYSKEVFVDFLNQFVDALKLDKFDIAGNSIGGYIAWNYALNYPEKVNKMILIDSVGYAQDLPRVVNFVNIPGMKKIASKIIPRLFIEKNIKEIYGDKTKVTDELVDLYHDMLLNQQNRGVFVDFFHLLKQEASSIQLSQGINKINSPTLLMWGKEDPWVPVNVLENWERDLTSSKTIVYDGVGHLPMEEIPLQSAYDAHTFLRS